LGEGIAIKAEWHKQDYLSIEDKAGNPYEGAQQKFSRDEKPRRAHGEQRTDGRQDHRHEKRHEKHFDKHFDKPGRSNRPHEERAAGKGFERNKGDRLHSGPKQHVSSQKPAAHVQKRGGTSPHRFGSNSQNTMTNIEKAGVLTIFQKLMRLVFGWMRGKK
jgi:hypothetical protein